MRTIEIAASSTRAGGGGRKWRLGIVRDGTGALLEIPQAGRYTYTGVTMNVADAVMNTIKLRYTLILPALAVLLAFPALSGCKGFDYPVTRVVLVVEYGGDWEIIAKPGDAATPATGNATYVYDESQGPFSFSIAKTDGLGGTLTATLSLRTVLIDGETAAETILSDEEIADESTSDPFGAVSLVY